MLLTKALKDIMLNLKNGQQRAFYMWKFAIFKKERNDEVAKNKRDNGVEKMM